MLSNLLMLGHRKIYYEISTFLRPSVCSFVRLIFRSFEPCPEHISYIYLNTLDKNNKLNLHKVSSREGGMYNVMRKQ